jgi:hypothetical protein
MYDNDCARFAGPEVASGHHARWEAGHLRPPVRSGSPTEGRRDGSSRPTTRTHWGAQGTLLTLDCAALSRAARQGPSPPGACFLNLVSLVRFQPGAPLRCCTGRSGVVAFGGIPSESARLPTFCRRESAAPLRSDNVARHGVRWFESRLVHQRCHRDGASPAIGHHPMPPRLPVQLSRYGNGRASSRVLEGSLTRG